METCLPASLYALSPCAPPHPLLAPLPNLHKLLQMPLVQEQAANNHGVMLSSDHHVGGGLLYPLLLPGIPFCPSAASAAATCEKTTTTGFAALDAGEVNEATPVIPSRAPIWLNDLLIWAVP